MILVYIRWYRIDTSELKETELKDENLRNLTYDKVLLVPSTNWFMVFSQR